MKASRLAACVSGVRTQARKAVAGIQPGALILLYHRVADVSADPQALCVTPERFSQHLAILGRQSKIVTLAELSAALRAGALPRRAVAVTYDDGYADNLYNAKPVLERNSVPATVFVTTGALGDSSSFWWDELEAMFLKPGVLPASLDLKVGGKQVSWSLATCAEYTDADYEQHSRWDVTTKGNPTARHDLYRQLCEILRPLPPPARGSTLAELRQWAKLESARNASHRPLTRVEVLELTAGGLVSVGSHTVSHPVLSELTEEEQEAEIMGSKADLERITGQSVTSFSYPYGTRRDYTSATVDLLHKAGFACACGNYAGRVRKGTDPYQLPRHIVRNWDGVEFARRLKEWWRG